MNDGALPDLEHLRHLLFEPLNSRLGLLYPEPECGLVDQGTLSKPLELLEPSRVGARSLGAVETLDLLLERRELLVE